MPHMVNVPCYWDVVLLELCSDYLTYNHAISSCFSFIYFIAGSPYNVAAALTMLLPSHCCLLPLHCHCLCKMYFSSETYLQRHFLFRELSSETFSLQRHIDISSEIFSLQRHFSFSDIFS